MIAKMAVSTVKKSTVVQDAIWIIFDFPEDSSA